MGVERQLGHLEGGGPALRALPERPHVRGLKTHPGEQLAGLRLGEGEVRAADLSQLVGHAQPQQPQRRVVPGGEHQPERGVVVLQQPLDVRNDRAGADCVEVVEDQDKRGLDPPELEQEVGERARAAGRHGQSRELGARGAHRVQHIHPERAAVGVLAAERQVRDLLRLVRGRHPRAQQHGLARSRGCGDQGQWAVRSPLDEVEQPRSLNHRGRSQGVQAVQTWVRILSRR